MLTGINQPFVTELAYVPVDTRESQERVTLYSWRVLWFPELFIWEVDSWFEGKQYWRGQILFQRSSILVLTCLPPTELDLTNSNFFPLKFLSVLSYNWNHVIYLSVKRNYNLLVIPAYARAYLTVTFNMYSSHCLNKQIAQMIYKYYTN